MEGELLGVKSNGEGKTGILKVVIADDEPIMRMNMIEILNGYPNQRFEVVASVADGFEAINSCREHHPEIALLDIEMPLLDGLTAAQCIYEEGLAETIIILTAYDSDRYIDKANAIGVSGYLVKPIDSRSLITSIRVAHGRSLEMKRLQDQVEYTNNLMEARKNIERAKGRLMEKMMMTEDAAYHYIRGISKSKSISMNEVAEIILKGTLK